MAIRCYSIVATVLTVYGIETFYAVVTAGFCGFVLLQQYLPFTVLKLSLARNKMMEQLQLQQYLPFTVLKHVKAIFHVVTSLLRVATVLTVYGIETNF